MKNDFPYLHSLGITINTDFNVRRLQRELLKLTSVVESVNLTEYTAANDKHRTSVLIPRSKTLNSFKTSLQRQGKGKTNWLTKIISSILPQQKDCGYQKEVMILAGFVMMMMNSETQHHKWHIG